MSPGEMWLGLKRIHQLTSGGDFGLRVTLMDFDRKTYFAEYDHFQVMCAHAELDYDGGDDDLGKHLFKRGLPFP